MDTITLAIQTLRDAGYRVLLTRIDGRKKRHRNTAVVKENSDQPMPMWFYNRRKVWAAVTRNPNATLRELSVQTTLSFGVVRYALCRLRDAGYIDFADNAARARRIIVPCGVQ